MSRSHSLQQPPNVQPLGRFQPQRTPVAKTVIVLVSVLFSLFACEAVLRLLSWPGLHNADFRELKQTIERPSDVPGVLRYIQRVTAAPGTDRRWFSDNPPRLPNRSQVAQWRVDRARDFQARGLFSVQSDYIWNRYYIESQRCAPDSVLRNFPENVLVFDPPQESTHPRYRFPPNTTTPAGLVTNGFGFRGAPITLTKPVRTIRIAFLGASTTVGYHPYQFSYPEYVVHWLNLYAKANHDDVGFEGLNAGREGINSEDIAAIVHDELRALDPDLAVYYEGSNQFGSARELISPRIPARADVDPRDPIVQHRVPAI